MSAVEKFWQRNGKLVVGNNGLPVKCTVCPCSGGGCSALFRVSCYLYGSYPVDDDHFSPVTIRDGYGISQVVSAAVQTPPGSTITGISFSPAYLGEKSHTSGYYEESAAFSYAGSGGIATITHKLKSTWLSPNRWMIADLLVTFTGSTATTGCSIAVTGVSETPGEGLAPVLGIDTDAPTGLGWYRPGSWQGKYAWYSGDYLLLAVPRAQAASPASGTIALDVDEVVSGGGLELKEHYNAGDDPYTPAPYNDMGDGYAICTPMLGDVLSCTFTGSAGEYVVFQDIARSDDLAYTAARTPAVNDVVFWFSDGGWESDGKVSALLGYTSGGAVGSSVEYCGQCGSINMGGVMTVPEEFE